LAIGWAVDVCAQGFSTAQPIDLTLGTYIGSTSAASYGDVALATDGTGLWIATWVVDDLSAPSDDLVVARSTDVGLTWSAPQSVKAVDGGHDTHPTVVYDGAGTFLLAWSSSDKLGGPVAGGDDDILLTRSIDGGMTWVTPVALAPNAATDVEEDDAPQLATDGSGNWVAVWQGFSDVLMSRSADGGAMWSAPVSIGSWGASEPRQVVQVATNGTG